MPIEKAQIVNECKVALDQLAVARDEAVKSGLPSSQAHRFFSIAKELTEDMILSLDGKQAEEKINIAKTCLSSGLNFLNCVQRNGERFQALARFQATTWLVGLDSDQKQQFLQSDLGKGIVQLLCQSYMALPLEKIKSLERLSQEPALRVLTPMSSLQSRLMELFRDLGTAEHSPLSGSVASSSHRATAGSISATAGVHPVVAGPQPQVVSVAAGAAAQPGGGAPSMSRSNSSGQVAGSPGTSSPSGGSSGHGLSASQLSPSEASRIAGALIEVIGDERALQLSILKRLCNGESDNLVESLAVGQAGPLRQRPIAWINRWFSGLLNAIDTDKRVVDVGLALVNDVDKLFTHLAAFELNSLAIQQSGTNDQSALDASRRALGQILSDSQEKLLNTRLEALGHAVFDADGWRLCSPEFKRVFSEILGNVVRDYRTSSSKPGLTSAEVECILGDQLKHHVLTSNGLIRQHIDSIRQYCVDQGISADPATIDVAINKSVLYLLRDCAAWNSGSRTVEEKVSTRNELLTSILLNLHCPDNPQHAPINAVRYLPLTVQTGQLIANKVLNRESGGFMMQRPPAAILRSVLDIQEKPKPAINSARSTLICAKSGGFFGFGAGQRSRANMVSSSIGSWLQSFVLQLNPDANLKYKTAVKGAMTDLKLEQADTGSAVKADFSDKRAKHLLHSQIQTFIYKLVAGGSTPEESDGNETTLDGILRAQLSNVGLNLHRYDSAIESAQKRSRDKVRLSDGKGNKIDGMYYNNTDGVPQLKESADAKLIRHNGDGKNRWSDAFTHPDQMRDHRDRTVLMSIALRTALWNAITNDGKDVGDALKVDDGQAVQWHGMMERLGLTSQHLTNQQLIRMSKLILSVVSPEAFRSTSLAGIQPTTSNPVGQPPSLSSIARGTKVNSLCSKLVGGDRPGGTGDTLPKGNLGTQLLDKLLDISKKNGSSLCDESDKEVVNCLLGLMLAQSKVDYHGAVTPAQVLPPVQQPQVPPPVQQPQVPPPVQQPQVPPPVQQPQVPPPVQQPQVPPPVQQPQVPPPVQQPQVPPPVPPQVTPPVQQPQVPPPVPQPPVPPQVTPPVQQPQVTPPGQPTAVDRLQVASELAAAQAKAAVLSSWLGNTSSASS